MAAISSKGTANMSRSTNANPLGRSQQVEDHQQRVADRVGQYRFVLGVGPVRTAHELIGDVLALGLLAP